MAHDLGQAVERDRFGHAITEPMAENVRAHIDEVGVRRIPPDDIAHGALGESDAGLLRRE